MGSAVHSHLRAVPNGVLALGSLQALAVGAVPTALAPLQHREVAVPQEAAGDVAHAGGWPIYRRRAAGLRGGRRLPL